jgi:hypothetical protein
MIIKKKLWLGNYDFGCVVFFHTLLLYFYPLLQVFQICINFKYQLIN